MGMGIARIALQEEEGAKSGTVHSFVDFRTYILDKRCFCGL